jgi:hypothetical protein
MICNKHKLRTSSKSIISPISIPSSLLTTITSFKVTLYCVPENAMTEKISLFTDGFSTSNSFPLTEYGCLTKNFG